MEIGDGLKKSVPGEIRNEMLEGSEGFGGLIGLFFRFQNIVGTGSADKVIDSPAAHFIVPIEFLPVFGGHQMDTASCLVRMIRQRFGTLFQNPGHIIHQLIGLFENIGVDLLEDVGVILPIFRVDHPVGFIDVTRSVYFGTFEQGGTHLKMRGYFLNFIFHSKRSFFLMPEDWDIRCRQSNPGSPAVQWVYLRDRLPRTRNRNWT